MYSLAIAGLLITMGNIADRVGRKKLLLIGATAFGIRLGGRGVRADAPRFSSSARLLLGVAGSTLMPSTLSLIRNIFTDPEERTRAIAIWSAAAASGIALGPLVGGALLEHFWWGSRVPRQRAGDARRRLRSGAWVLPESKNPSPHRLDLISSALVDARDRPVRLRDQAPITGAVLWRVCRHRARAQRRRRGPGSCAGSAGARIR